MDGKLHFYAPIGPTVYHSFRAPVKNYLLQTRERFRPATNQKWTERQGELKKWATLSLSFCLFSLSFFSFSYLSFSPSLSHSLSLSLNLKYSNNILSRKELHLTTIKLLLSYLPSHAMQHRPKINGRQLPPRLLEVKLPYDPVCPSVRWLDGRLVGRSVIIS